MLSHSFLQTLLQSLDPTPDGFPITLDRAAASQKIIIKNIILHSPQSAVFIIRATAAADNDPAGEAGRLSRVCPPRRCKATADQLQAATTSTGPRTVNAENYQSSVARHLTENKAYDDSCFRVLCMGRAKWCLEVLEALFIRSRTRAKPVYAEELFNYA